MTDSPRNTIRIVSWSSSATSTIGGGLNERPGLGITHVLEEKAGARDPA